MLAKKCDENPLISGDKIDNSWRLTFWAYFNCIARK